MSGDSRPYSRGFNSQPEPIVPPLHVREQPGLSATLTCAARPDRCQSCGSPHRETHPLARWHECDPWDRPTSPAVVVVLCRGCSDRLIEPHPRLYVRLDQLAPCPGAMSVCLHCTQRDGVMCRSPEAKQNGGPGLTYGWADGKLPTVAHVCGTRNGRRTGWTATMWPGKVLTCSGRSADG